MNNVTIINKMIDELERAKEKSASKEELLPHIRNVKLLSELFLEDVSNGDMPAKAEEREQSQAISDREMKAMLGEKTTRKQTRDKEEPQGDSIFDF